MFTSRLETFFKSFTTNITDSRTDIGCTKGVTFKPGYNSPGSQRDGSCNGSSTHTCVMCNLLFSVFRQNVLSNKVSVGLTVLHQIGVLHLHHFIDGLLVSTASTNASQYSSSSNVVCVVGNHGCSQITDPTCTSRTCCSSLCSCRSEHFSYSQSTLRHLPNWTQGAHTLGHATG